MVSPWQKNGHVLEYIKVHDAQIDYNRLVRLPSLKFSL